MEFSADDIANHSDNLNAIGDAAVDDLRSYCSDLFSGVDWSDADDDTRKQLRNQVIDHVNYIQETYGSASESIGSLFFDNALSSDGKLANAVMAGTANSQQVSNSVRYWARHLFGEDPDLDAFVDGVSAFVRRTVTHAADLSVAESAVSTNEQQDLGIRYARVPQGPTCSFCIMLASRGFVYASKESAGELGQYHDDCNCRIVAGMPGTEVEGYDPKGMYERYLSCRDAITHGETGSRNPVWRDWKRLSPEEQASYAEATGGDAYNNYLAHRIVQEMSTRDRQWLYDGAIPQYEIEDGAIPSKKEIDLVMFLQDQGFRSVFRKTRSKDGKRTSDVFFFSGKNGEEKIAAEMKQPSGNGKQTISHQFEEAAGQAKVIIIDADGLGEYWTDERIIDEVYQKVNREHTIKKGKNKGDKWAFDRAIIKLKSEIISITRREG